MDLGDGRRSELRGGAHEGAGVSGETIRATLERLGVRWERAKRWITSPDPEYARKKKTARPADPPGAGKILRAGWWVSKTRLGGVGFRDPPSIVGHKRVIPCVL